ncbi:MAG: hypothetical protein J6U01_08895, partial [Clostridia bacterium]|nr:hypothetical protein [Clostridia bacterium]
MPAARFRVDHLMYAAGDSLRNTIRTGITLTEPVDSDILREAVNRLPERFPYFAVRLVRENDSLFYEPNSAPYVIAEDGRTLPLGGKESNGHLVAFTCRGNTLFVDSSH